VRATSTTATNFAKRWGYFAGRPRVESVRVDAVEAESGDVATVAALVSYADGTAGVVKVALRKGEPAWLVDWRATRALGE